MKQNTKYNFIIVTSVIFIGFFMFGFSENVKGVAIPIIQNEFKLSEIQIGTLLALNSLGYLLACSFTGWLSKNIGLKVTNILCFLLMALSGVLIYFSTSFIRFTGSYFIMYLGNGMLEISLGILAAKIFTKNTGTMMNLAHFFYGLSSMVAPLLATGLIGTTINNNVLGWRGMYLIILLACLLPIIPSIFGKFPHLEEEDKCKMSLKCCIKNSTVWLVVLILSFGVTCEMGIGGWLVNYLQKTQDFSNLKASVILSSFFFCFTLARLIFGPFIDKIGFIKALLIASAFSGISIIVGVILGKFGVILLILAGLGIAVIYPTVMALLAKLYPESIDVVMTFVLTLMGITIVIGNFLVGVIIEVCQFIFTKIYSVELGFKLGYSVGYMFLGICCLICFLGTFILHKRIDKDKKTI